MSRTPRIRQQTWTTPAAANTGVHAAIALPKSGVTEATTAITNPGVPRTIRLRSSQLSVDALEVILEGTNILDQRIGERVTLGSTATPTDITKAFKTLTRITVATKGAAGDTISVGPGVAPGLECAATAPHSAGSLERQPTPRTPRVSRSTTQCFRQLSMARPTRRSIACLRDSPLEIATGRKPVLFYSSLPCICSSPEIISSYLAWVRAPICNI